MAWPGLARPGTLQHRHIGDTRPDSRTQFSVERERERERVLLVCSPYVLSVTSGEWTGAHRHTTQQQQQNNININLHNINNINKTKMMDSLPEGLTRPAIPGYDPSFSHMMGKFWGLLSPPGSDGSGSQESEEQKIPTHSGR